MQLGGKAVAVADAVNHHVKGQAAFVPHAYAR
jgi:hypothetical protein